MFCCFKSSASPEPQARRRRRRSEHQSHQRRHQVEEHELHAQQVPPRHPELRPEYELYFLHELGVRTLQNVGYSVLGPVQEFHPLSGKEMMLYVITCPAALARTRDNVIAKLGVLDDPSQLVVQRIYTVNDNRPDESKPHANEIILSFWGLYLGRDIKSIRSLFFCDVKEKTLKTAKKHVYAQMGNVDSRQPLAIRTGQGFIEETQFNRISVGTKFGRLAQKVGQSMNLRGFRVVEFMFLPFSDQHDGDEDSEDSEVSGDSEDGEAGQAEEIYGRYVGGHKVSYNFQIFLG